MSKQESLQGSAAKVKEKKRNIEPGYQNGSERGHTFMTEVIRSFCASKRNRPEGRREGKKGSSMPGGSGKPELPEITNKEVVIGSLRTKFREESLTNSVLLKGRVPLGRNIKKEAERPTKEIGMGVTVRTSVGC